MTKAEIDALAKKYVDANKLNMLLVGDKAKIMAGLVKLGYPIVELDADGKPIEKKGF
jgi:zinc protease